MAIALGLLAIIIGILGGMSGVGGFLMAPVMMEVMGVSAHLAMAMSQATFIVPGILAVKMFASAGNIQWRFALPVSVSGCLFSFFGAWYVKPLQSGSTLSLILGACITLAGFCLLFPPKMRRSVTSAEAERKRAVWIVAGAAVGLVTGIAGSGSNALLVPAMIMAGLEPLAVLGTCHLFSLLASATGTFGNMLSLSMDGLTLVFMTACQMLGVWFGVKIAQQCNVEKLKRWIGGICLASGLFMCLRACY